ncbi:Hexaprenyldihydroxybenzoate methyltransferase, mitochondrial, partial [Coemansia sp. RSA 2681]
MLLTTKFAALKGVRSQILAPLLRTARVRRNYSSTADVETRGSHSVTPSELEKFAKVSDSWWDPQGPFKYLHTMNRTRTQFIRSHLADLSRLPRQETLGRAWIRGRRVVDIGCGGGLASESLARLGMQVLG